MSESMIWSCGHQAGVVCEKCHEELIQRANKLAAENERLIDRLDSMIREVTQLREQVDG